MNEAPDPEVSQPAGLEDPSQSPLVRAFQVAIKDLQDEAAAARKAVRVRTRWMAVIGAACVALVGVAVMAFIGLSQAKGAAHQAQAATRQVQQGSLNSCLDGNANRAGTVLAIDRLVTLLANGRKDPATVKAVRDYEAYVLSVNEPQDCYAVYHVAPPSS